MIALLTRERRDQYLALCDLLPVIGARMHTQLAVYGYDSPIATHWLALAEDGAPTAAILRFDGWIVISANDGVDIPELADFLEAVGEFRYLESSPALCRALGDYIPGRYASSLTMRYTGGPIHEDFGAVDEHPPLRQVFDLICAGSKFMADTTHWENWYPHTSHLIRHGLGFSSLLRDGDKPIATGGVYTTSPGYGIIGSLTTLSEYRGRGCAALLTRYLVDQCLKRGLTPALYCASDSLAQYYGRLGFSAFGEWGEIALEG